MRRSILNQKNIINAPLINNTVILNEANDNITDDEVHDNGSRQAPLNLDRFPTVIEVIKGSMLFGTPENETSKNQQNTVQTMESAAKQAKLDEKQQVAFQVICTTFMLSWLEELFARDQHRAACGAVSERLSSNIPNDFSEATSLLKSVEHGVTCSCTSVEQGSVERVMLYASRRYCSNFCCTATTWLSSNASAKERSNPQHHCISQPSR